MLKETRGQEDELEIIALTKIGLAQEIELSQQILRLISEEAMTDSRTAKNVADFYFQLIVELGNEQKRISEICKRMDEK